MKNKFLMIALFILLTSCSFRVEEEYVETCMATAIANPLNLINGFIDSLQNDGSSNDNYNVNKFRDYCKCGFNETIKNLNFIEKFKYYYLDIGISDPIISKIIQGQKKVIASCTYILDETLKDSLNENQDAETKKSFVAEINKTPSNRNKNESIFSKLRKSSEISSDKKESEMQEKKYGSENSSSNSNHDKKDITTLYEYQTNTGCIYKEISPSKQNNRSIFWDGSCQNGFLQGFGSLIIDDKLKNTTTVCEANYSSGLENGQGKCTYNHNNNEMIITETGIYKNGKFVSGSREYEDQGRQYKKDILENPSYPGNQGDSSQSQENYSNLISKKIRKNFFTYPKIAQMRGWQGTVIADLEIDSKGSVISVKIKKSSSYEVLDKEALEMIKKASPFPPPPDNLRGKNFNVLVPISFKLE
jgi:TonB family protein